MPFPYIVSTTNEFDRNTKKSVTISRKYVVISGNSPYEQVYYLSSKTNSDARQWLPCMMRRGLGMDRLNLEYRLWDKSNQVRFEDAMERIKTTDFGAIIKIASPMYCFDDDRLLRENISTSTGFCYPHRLPTKSHLIMSSRLSLGSKEKDEIEGYTPDLLKKLGLNGPEIKQALEPLELEDKPQGVFYEDGTFKDSIVIDQVNEWLADQGAVIARDVIENQKKQLSQFEPGWQEVEKSLEKKGGEIKLKQDSSSKQVLQAKQFLAKKYTKGDWSGRFFSLAWGRNHISVVNTVLKEDYSSLDDLMKSLAIKLEESRKSINDNGQLMKCIYFIMKKNNEITRNIKVTPCL